MKIKVSDAVLNAQEIGITAYGLQGFNSDWIEVRDLIRVLTVKYRISKAVLNAQHIGNAVY